MIQFSYLEILKSLSVMIVLMILNSIQFVIKPADYFSTRSVVVNFDKNRVLKSSFTKIIITFIVSGLFLWLGFSKKIILTGFISKELLQIWVSFSYLKIFSKWNKFKLKYFFICVLSFALSLLYAWWCLYQLIPAFTKDKELIVFSNDAVTTLLSIILYVIPISIDYAIIPKRIGVKYNDIDSLHADLIVLRNLIELECAYIDSYENEIEKYSKENNIPKQLLYSVLCLEYTNRSSVFYKWIEKLLVKTFKGIVVKKDISIGLAQIKPSTAKEVLKESPYEFIDKMLGNVFSVELCAKLLRLILDEYEEDYKKHTENNWCFDDNVFSYIASKYLCGCKTSYRRNTLLYESIISNMCRDSDINSYIDVAVG